MKILGLDPGVNTGAAHFISGQLVHLETVVPLDIERTIIGSGAELVIFEDSRLISKLFTTDAVRAKAGKIGRNVGEIDAWCKLIEAACQRAAIDFKGISPMGKGKKHNAEAFERVTGWTGRTNPHERDAAMVVWPYRRAAKTRNGVRRG